jgi:hypothetical protein
LRCRDSNFHGSFDVFQFPKDQGEQVLGIVSGVIHSIQFSPEATLSILERWIEDNQRINRMVQDILNREREFTSSMARGWTKAMSDQTYVIDPVMNEIFRVHKRAWETDEFWRDPLWGTILSGVERESELERLLQEEGWRPLQHSLEGFPKR